MSTPALGLCLWAFYALFYLHSFVCVCTEIEAATKRASASASVLLNWQKSVARLTAYNEGGEREMGEGGLAKQLMDSLRREVGSDFSYLFRMRVLIMPYYSPRQAQ